MGKVHSFLSGVRYVCQDMVTGNTGDRVMHSTATCRAGVGMVLE